MKIVSEMKKFNLAHYPERSFLSFLSSTVFSVYCHCAGKSTPNLVFKVRNLGSITSSVILNKLLILLNLVSLHTRIPPTPHKRKDVKVYGELKALLLLVSRPALESPESF